MDALFGQVNIDLITYQCNLLMAESTAMWTQGTNWPANGEIDIFESVNLRTVNQEALHTSSGYVSETIPYQRNLTDDLEYMLWLIDAPLPLTPLWEHLLAHTTTRTAILPLTQIVDALSLEGWPVVRSQLLEVERT